MADELAVIPNPELDMLIHNKRDGYTYRERRHEDWLENYTLSRDRVILNRLTQRQSVNLPLMKTMLRTLLKDVDDMPVMFFENLDNDKQAEIFKNEFWKLTGEQNKFEIQDIIDKRQVFHYGRSFDQWQIIDGKVSFNIIDPMDILVSRYMDPHNIHSSRFLVHMHIFKPLSKLKQNPFYDQEAIARLEQWYGTEQGLIKAADNLGALAAKNEKLAEMGVVDIDHPVLGETYVELTQQLVFREREIRKGKYFEDQIFLYTEADEQAILRKQPLEEVIGETKDHHFQIHYPYNTWADDIEKQDFWSDGVADIVRTPNKIANAWFSQLVENRTLRNLNMNLFNSSIENWAPQTWEPRAWGMYGIPVPQNQKIDDVFKQLPVADLSDSLDEMNFLITMVEKATGATATQQGVQTARQITLGEVKLDLQQAQERIKGMSKFYTQVWKERGLMFTKLIEAASDKIDAVKIYKKGKNTDTLYGREISPKDWITESGYYCRVWDQSEKNEQDTQKLEKINAIKGNMPDNPTVDEVYKRQLLEFGDFTPDEVNRAMEFEKQKQQAIMSAAAQVGPQQPGMPMQPGAQPQLPAQAGQPMQPMMAQ